MVTVKRRIKIFGAVKFFFLLLACLILFITPVRTVLAANVDCGTLAQQDCAALHGNWVNWVPDDGSSSCSGATVPTGTLPSLIPEPYNGAFTAAGKAYNVSPVLIASIFTEEHFTNDSTDHLAERWKGLLKSQPDPNSGWATSPDQAKGPFQFIPSTWASLGVDADHNGVKDVENLLDAAYGAANYMKTDGATANKPKSVWVNFADGYSGHTGGYADSVSKYIDFYASGGSSVSTSGSTADTSTGSSASCGSAGAVAGDIVQTALNFAWQDVTYPSHGSADTPSCTSPDPAQNPSSCHHGFQQLGANSPKVYTRQTYQDAWAKYNNAGSTSFTDCGVYVATVLRASGVAKDYPASGSGGQLQWAQSHPDKYTVIGSPTVSDLQPGDVLVNSEHTFIYVGHVPSTKFTVAEASQDNHSPELDNVVANEINGFSLVRVKA